MVCERCKKEFFIDWRKKKKSKCRFCSLHCANVRVLTKEHKDKISISIKNKKIVPWNKKKLSDEELNLFFLNKRNKKPTSILEVSKRTASKILKRLKIPCSLCGWFHENVICDLHHIIPKKYKGSDEHDNLTYICPNCHRLVHSNIIKKENLISIKDYINDDWINKYYG